MATKKIIFLPFINGEAGIKWRRNLETTFLQKDEDAQRLTAAIEEIRKEKPKTQKREEAETEEYKAALRDYYARLHEEKTKRQALWIRYLSEQTARLLEKKLNEVPHNNSSEDVVVVAALPEFFWCDINDDKKHGWSSDPKKFFEFIPNYHKPLYKPIFDFLSAQDNPLTALTAQFQDLIIFAGTALWKIINEDSHKEEKTYNTLIVYHTGKVDNIWSKCFFSSEDGFGSGKENKKGEVGIRDGQGNVTTMNQTPPFSDFHGVTFVYDICRDFVEGKDQRPLSADLYEERSPDVNVLIAAGMPLSTEKMQKIQSPVILRCDGAGPVYAEIAEKCRGNEQYPDENPNSISCEDEISKSDEIGVLVIDTEPDSDCCCIIQ